jgi:replicative DNA helicase
MSVKTSQKARQEAAPRADKDDFEESEESVAKVCVSAACSQAPFPIRCFPYKAREMAEATAESVNVHINLPASAILGVCSAACGKGLFLQSGPDQRLRPNLFIMGAAITGTGKSEGVRPIIDPFKLREIDKRSHFDEIIRPDLESEKRLLEKKLNSIEAILGRAKSSKSSSAINEKALRKEHHDGIQRLQQIKEEIKGLSMSAEDVTQEEAAILLAQNNEQLFIYSPDAAKAVANLEGLYNKLSVPDDNLFVKGYSGDPHTVHRVSRSAIYLSSPCITLLWYLQPDLVTRILENSRLRVGGFFARLLICDTQLEPTEIRKDARPIPLVVRAAYNDTVRDLLLNYWESKKEHEIKVDPDARELLRSFHNELVPRRKSDLSDVGGFVARWHEQAWRIAGTCHAIKHGKDAHHFLLTVKEAEHAIEISRWFGDQQLQVLAAARHAALRESALKLMQLIQENYSGSVSLRNLQVFHNRKPQEVMQIAKSFSIWFEIFDGKTPGPGRSSPWIRLKKSSFRHASA